MARTQQLSFLNEPADAHGPIVNVASVPQRSPFRYPGGILAPGSGKLKHGENGKGVGSRWYPDEIDHESLFKLASELTGDFLMTYDNAPELHALARRYGFDAMIVAMKNTHHAEMTELLIGRNLEWARRLPAVADV